MKLLYSNNLRKDYLTDDSTNKMEKLATVESKNRQSMKSNEC